MFDRTGTVMSGHGLCVRAGGCDAVRGSGIAGLWVRQRETSDKVREPRLGWVMRVSIIEDPNHGMTK